VIQMHQFVVFKSIDIAYRIYAVTPRPAGDLTHLVALRSRVAMPSNLWVVENTTRRMGRLRPMPMASVATRMSASPLQNLLASVRRTFRDQRP